MREMHAEGLALDHVLLPERLAQARELTHDDDAYSAHVVRGLPTAANWRAYAELVRDKADKRRLLTFATRQIKAAYSDEAAEQSIARANEEMAALISGRSPDYFSPLTCSQ